LTNPSELAFNSGFRGERRIQSWQRKLDALQRLGFISVRPGPNGNYSYVLIFNPHIVISELWQKGTPGLREDSYNALQNRAIEIGAKDLPRPKVQETA
jgi:hypothetical protein